MDSIYSDDINRDIVFEDLRQMKYLENVIKETLRLFPPVLLVSRELLEDFKVKEYLIPTGTTCVVLLYALHRDPKYFPNPEIFDPDRFLPENYRTRHPFAFVPFSAGPRNCIGQRFAMQAVKVVLTSVLRKYRVTSLLTMDKMELAIGTTLGAKNPIKLKMELRENYQNVGAENL